VPKVNLRILPEGSKTLTINAISLSCDIPGSTPSVFDAGGLAPLEIPTCFQGFVRYQRENASGNVPSEGTVVRFQEAMTRPSMPPLHDFPLPISSPNGSVAPTEDVIRPIEPERQVVPNAPVLSQTPATPIATTHAVVPEIRTAVVPEAYVGAEVPVTAEAPVTTKAPELVAEPGHAGRVPLAHVQDLATASPAVRVETAEIPAKPVVTAQTVVPEARVTIVETHAPAPAEVSVATKMPPMTEVPVATKVPVANIEDAVRVETVEIPAKPVVTAQTVVPEARATIVETHAPAAAEVPIATKMPSMTEVPVAAKAPVANVKDTVRVETAEIPAKPVMTAQTVVSEARVTIVETHAPAPVATGVPTTTEVPVTTKVPVAEVKDDVRVETAEIPAKPVMTAETVVPEARATIAETHTPATVAAGVPVTTKAPVANVEDAVRVETAEIPAKPVVTAQTVVPEARTTIAETHAPAPVAAEVPVTTKVPVANVEDAVRVETAEIPAKPVVTAQTAVPEVRTAPEAIIAEVSSRSAELPAAQTVKPKSTSKPEPLAEAQENVSVAIQAAPIPVAIQPETVAAPEKVALEINPAAASARTHELVETAAQVADTILVTPSLAKGDGEVVIHLKPNVLDGSEIHIEAKGTSLSIAIAPTTPEIGQLIERSSVQFEQMLSERIPSFQIAVAVLPRHSTEKKAIRDETV